MLRSNRQWKTTVPPYQQLKVVRFQFLEKPNEDAFCLQLSRIFNYDDVTKRVATQLRLADSTKIRLTFHIRYPPQPQSQPIEYKGGIQSEYETCDILYFEVLDIPLPDLRGLKTLNITFRHATKDEVLIHSVTHPNYCTVGDVINDLKAKVVLCHPNALLRLLAVRGRTIMKIFPVSQKIETIYDRYQTLRAEEIPDEEKNLGSLDHLIHVRHCTKNPSPDQSGRISSTPVWFHQHWSFWEPFILRVNEGETLAKVKVRIQKKLQVPDDEFFKWKFRISLRGHLDTSNEYLSDSDIVSARLDKGRDIYESWENCQCLFLEHLDSVSTLKKVDASNQKRLNSENEEKEPKKAKAEATHYTIIKQEKDVMLDPHSEYTDSLQPREVAQAEAVSAVQTKDVEVSLSARESSEITPSPEYPGAGQLYEKGKHRVEVLDEKFEDVGGFSVLKTQASLYTKIWLKFGHIASSQVLAASLYSAQVTVVTDIMTTVMDMYKCEFAKVSSVMIDEWESKIKMAEKLEFNIKWLRERFEDIRKDYYGEQNHKASIDELLQSLQYASARVKEVEDELQKAKEQYSALHSRVSPMYFESRIYELKRKHLLFEGLL